MSFERFIARRFLPKDSVSQNISRYSLVATASIALGVLVMAAAICILRGFQGEIRQKVVGFGSHIVVQSFQMGTTSGSTFAGETTNPIATDRPEVALLRNTPGVRHLQFFAQKGGMVKTQDQIHGIILKGVDKDYDTTFFAQYLVEGRLPDFKTQGDSTASNEVLISQTIADKLEVGVGDKLRTFFWQNNAARARAFTVCGIYRTDLTDFDDHFIVGDLRQVQRLNNWGPTDVDGYEILIDPVSGSSFYSHLDATAARLLPLLGYDLTITTIVQQNPALFSWLDLLDSNIVLIITIMILVCAVAILSALLIMIFEKTSTIGMLKALGATNASVRRIFLIKAGGIIVRGIIIGDAIALLLCGLQYHLRLLRLDSESYSMDFVPVDLNPWIFILVSLGTLLLCLVTLLLPTAYISNIHPAKTIRFE